MSEVYLADDIISGKKLALKILDTKLSINPEYLHRFKKEASICQQLNHKNIVKIQSYGTFKGSYYIAYDYIDGITLDKYIRQKNLTISEIENISVQILEALSFAHSKNIIHRDIKPSNIMLENGTVKVLDFGIAKQELSATVTKTGLFMGSPHYVSPEQIEGHNIDNRSDLYSFGIVLYEIIEGKVPYSADTPWGIVRAHLDKSIPEITKHPPNYLKEVVYKCLSKKKEDRFKSTDEIISIIRNKGEIGSKTVIINKEKETEAFKADDYISIDTKNKEEVKRKRRSKIVAGVLVPIFIILVTIGIIIVNQNNKNYIVESNPTSSYIITTILTETTTTLPIQTTTTYYKTTTTQYLSTTTTSYSNQNYENNLAESKFLDNMHNLLNEYNSISNHINTYGGGNVTFGESNTIEFEGSVLVRYQELSNKLKNFSCPSSYKSDKNNLIEIADAICFYQNEVVDINKNGSYEAYVNSFNACNQKISDLFNYTKNMISIYNSK